MTRGFLNGETRLEKLQSLYGKQRLVLNNHTGGTWGTETSKYPEEEKITMIS